MKKKFKNLEFCFFSAIILILLAVFVYNFLCHNRFWDTPFYNIMMLFVALLVTYHFNQKNTDKRKRKELISENIEKILDRMEFFSGQDYLQKEHAEFVRIRVFVSEKIRLVKHLLGKMGICGEANALEEEVEKCLSLTLGVYGDIGQQGLAGKYDEVQISLDVITIRCNDILMKIY